MGSRTPPDPGPPRREDTAATPDGISNRPTQLGRGRWLVLLLVAFAFVSAIVIFGGGSQ
jgi:hypothetical protein